MTPIFRVMSEVMLNPLEISVLVEMLGHFSVSATLLLLLLSHINLSSLRIIPCPFLPPAAV